MKRDIVQKQEHFSLRGVLNELHWKSDVAQQPLLSTLKMTQTKHSIAVAACPLAG